MTTNVWLDQVILILILLMEIIRQVVVPIDLKIMV